MNAAKIFEQLMKQARGAPNLSGQGGGQTAGGFDMKSMLGTGALGMLLGSRRRKGGSLLKYAALAGIGKLAWDAYQNHQAAAKTGQAAAQPIRSEAQAGRGEGQPLEQLAPPAQERRGLELLQAMIMAARADGHIDASERAQLTVEIEKLGADAELSRWVQQQFDAPLDAKALASQADSPQAAREMYLVSVAMIDEQNPLERVWLDELAQALRIDAALARQIERQLAAS